MKRYGICRIVGTGIGNDRYRPKVNDYFYRQTDEQPEPPYESDYTAGLVKLRSLVGVNASGSLRFPWAFVVVDAPRLALLADDPDIRQLPDATLDMTVGSLSATIRSKLRADFDAFGIDRTWINNQTLIREVVRYLVKQHFLTLSEDDFDPAGG